MYRPVLTSRSDDETPTEYRPMDRCKSYLRARGLFIYSGVRCTLDLGHTGRHIAPGRFIDPSAAHRWGRA